MKIYLSFMDNDEGHYEQWEGTYKAIILGMCGK